MCIVDSGAHGRGFLRQDLKWHVAGRIRALSRAPAPYPAPQASRHEQTGL